MTDHTPAAMAAWEAYLDREKWVYGMPGLKARPSFLAGYAAALAARAAQGLTIAVDPAVPSDTVEIRQGGRTVGRIVNTGGKEDRNG